MAFVQIAFNQRASGTGNVDAVFGSNVTAGNVIVAVSFEDAGTNPNITFSTASGSTSAWTERDGLNNDNAGDFFGMEGAWATVSSTGALTVRAASAASSFMGLIAFEISSFSAYDTETYTRGTTSPIALAATPNAAPGTAVLLCVDWSGSSAGPGVPSGWTDGGLLLDYAGNNICRVAYRSYTDTTQLTASLTDAAGGPWHGVVILITETSAGGTVFTETLTSNLSLTDLAPLFMLRNRRHDDAVTVTEGQTIRSTHTNMDATDEISVADSGIQTAQRNRQLTDTIDISDSALWWMLRNRLLESGIDAVDSLMSEVFTGNVFTRVLTSEIAAIDELLTASIYIRQASDTLVITDQNLTAMQRFRVLESTLSFFDELVSQVIAATTQSPKIVIGSDPPDIILDSDPPDIVLGGEAL